MRSYTVRCSAHALADGEEFYNPWSPMCDSRGPFDEAIAARWVFCPGAGGATSDEAMASLADCDGPLSVVSVVGIDPDVWRAVPA